MKKYLTILFLLLLPFNVFAEWTLNEKIVLYALKDFKNKPENNSFFDLSYAYAVIPRVITAGALGIKGTGGKGMTFVNGTLDSCIRLRGGGIGLAAGGQSYKEIIFFQNKESYEKFKSGKSEWSGSAEAGGQFGEHGERPQASFIDGLYIDIITIKGLMFDVSLGVQRFKYKPLNKNNECKW